MGSQPSKVQVLKCPKNYDPQKFKKITTLFDKLDKDSNLGVSNDEIEHIAALHIKNCITRMQKTKQAKGKALQVAKTQLTLDQKSATDKIINEFQAKTKEEERIHSAAVQTLDNRIEWYESLDNEGKSNAFMKAVMPAGEEHIDFWSFFEYMKHKTEDIQNIEK